MTNQINTYTFLLKAMHRFDNFDNALVIFHIKVHWLLSTNLNITLSK